MREDAQFNLVIVTGDQYIARGRKECLADLLSLFIPYTDILQIRLARGKPAGLCGALIIDGMDLSVFLDILFQSFRISAVDL